MEGDLDMFAILPEDKIPEKGKILISEPFLPDTFFNRSIVYLTDHSPEGSVGFIINKKIDLKMSSAITGFEGWDENINMGGPVAPDTIHYLHNLGDMIPKSVFIEDNIFWGGDIDAIREMVKEGAIKRSQIRFFLGYSGWSAGQLERELKEDSWVIAKVKPEIIMSNRGEDAWKRILRGLQNKYRIWADFPDSPEMN